MFKLNTKKILLILLIFVSINILAVANVGAQTSDPPPKTGSTLNVNIKKQLDGLAETGLPGEEKDPTRPVVNLVKQALGFVAFVFLLLLIYAGFKWMSSGGNPETIEKSKKIIQAALIGLVVIFLSYAITAFVFNVVLST